MEAFDIIKRRRSVRRYTNEAVEEGKLRRLVEAAVWAPSAGNIQAWDIVIVQREDEVDRIKAVSPGLLGNPKALMALCVNGRKAYEKGGEKGRDVLALMDVAIAAQNICLEATELGLGSCIVKSFNQAAVAELLDLPAEFIPELLISLGYPEEIPNPPRRRAAEEAIIRWLR